MGGIFKLLIAYLIAVVLSGQQNHQENERKKIMQFCPAGVRQ
jgi:hypothetical protein